MLELHDIPAPENLLPGTRVAWWIWLCAAMVISGLAWLIKYRHRQISLLAVNPDDSYQLCREELNEFREQISGLPLADVASRCSLILRSYMRIHIDEQALYETHDEFLLRPEALRHLPKGARDKLAPFLSKLARCKYGPSNVDPSGSEAVIGESLQILQGLESTRERAIT